MKKRMIFLASLLVIANAISVLGQQSETPQKYQQTWESLQNYQVPEWFLDSKFGIFIHWGVYSVPAFESEWYPRFMYMNDKSVDLNGTLLKDGPSWVYEHHTEKYGTLDKFGYKDFIPMFKGENFNAKQWIDIIKESGAKYVVPVAEHHDGFAMYASNITRWNSAEMGPKVDVLGELMKEGRKQGLIMGASSHFAWNWYYYTKNEGSDAADPQYNDLYGRMHAPYADVEPDFLQLWWARTKDIIDNYQPDMLWFDFCIDRKEFAPYHKKLAAYYYNQGEKWNRGGNVLTNKNMFYPSFPEGTNIYEVERGKLTEIAKHPWQSESSIGANSWGYITNWIARPTNVIVDDLIDIVSKNGNLLLNIGPKADGTIPEDQQQGLREIGTWLKQNGEAIYGTRPWKIYGEGPTGVAKGHHSESQNKVMTDKDIRFTSKGDILYAIVMDWPKEGKVVINSLAQKNKLMDDNDKITSIELLGHGPLKWKQTNSGLEVKFPETPCGDFAYVLKIDKDKR